MATANSEDETMNLIDLIAQTPQVKKTWQQQQSTITVNGVRSLLDATIMEGSPQRNNGLEIGQNSTPVAATLPETDNRATSSKRGPIDNQEIENLRTTCAGLELIKDYLQKQLLERNDTCDELRRHLKSETIKLDEYQIFHDSEFSVWQEERQELQTKIDRLQTSNEKLTLEFNQLKTDRDESNKECEELFLKLHTAEKRIGKLIRIEAAKECLQEQFNNLQEAYDDLQQKHQLSIMDQSLTTTTNNDDVLAQSMVETESLKVVNAQLENRLAKMEEELNDFRSAAQEQMVHSEEMLIQKDNEISELEKQLDNAQERLRLLKESMDNIEGQKLQRLHHSMDEIRRLEMEKSELEQKLEKEIARSTTLEEDVVRLEAVCDQADAIEAKYEVELNDLKAKYEEELNDLKKRHQELTNQNFFNGLLAAKSPVKQQRIENLENQLKEKDVLINQLEIKLQTIQQEIVATRQQSQQDNSVSSTKDNSSGHGLVFSTGSAIMESGSIQALRAENYNLQKKLKRFEAEKMKCFEDKKVEKSSLPSQASEKENVVQVLQGGENNNLQKKLKRSESYSD